MDRPADVTFRDRTPATPRRSSASAARPTGTGEGVDPSLILRIIYRRRWLAILTFVAIVVPATAWTLLQQPVYAASVRIAIDPEPTAPLQFTKGQNDAPPADAMQTQRKHARWLREEKKAHFVFPVLDNQPTLFDRLDTLD